MTSSPTWTTDDVIAFPGHNTICLRSCRPLPRWRSLARNREWARIVRSLGEVFEDRGTALGAWISLREPLLAEAAGLAEFDYVVIDMQHGLADFGDVVNMLQVLARTPAVPVVRVPWNEPGVIGRVLDAGALSVIVPLVSSVEEARAAVAACRFPPEGSRSFGPLVARTRYGADYFKRANDLISCIPMIETRQAVEQLDEILAVPGIGTIYVGPSDLSLSYELAPAVDQRGELFDGVLTRIVDACQRHGVVPGIHADPSLAQIRHSIGFRMITVGFDAAPAIAALRADAVTARAAIGRG